MQRRVTALVCLSLAAVLLLAGPAEAQNTADFEALRAPRGPFRPDVPRPESVLGFVPGTDFRLADWPSILEYLRALDEASDRIVLEQIGESAEGQPLVLAVISSAENLRDRDRYRQIAAQLASADGIDEPTARALAQQGKAIVWIDSGLHATEVAHGQHAPELAWIAVASESPEMQRIRNDVILLLMPNMNPDGLNLVARWYRQNLGTPFETAPVPFLYQKYAGHDNNRDWYMIQLPETRAVARQLYRTWFPQIVYNHHQTAPFPARIFVPPFNDPANPNIPPLVLRGIARVGNAITTRLEQEGKAGAVSRLGFTAWWNGGMRTAPYFHNMIGILTETALYRYATPRFYGPDELPSQFRDGTSTRQPSIKYPMPWPGGWWRLRDPIEYMLTASIATLDVASRYRKEWLLNSWRMAAAERAHGQAGNPAGWVVPASQHDPAAAVELVNVLRRGGLRVERATAEFEADGHEYPIGSYIVPAAQAFRRYAMDLLQPQRYPDRRLYPGGPPNPPYDLTGWTLPLQMGVRVDRIERPFQGATEPVTAPAHAEGEVTGQGSTYVLSTTDTGSFAAVNRLLRAGVAVMRTSQPLSVGNTSWAPGTFLVRAEPGVAGHLAQIAAEQGVQIRALSQRLHDDGWRLRSPRIGLYDPWVANMDAGWTRFVLDRYGFEYQVLRNAQIQKGDLGAAFDAIILPSASPKVLLEGHRPGSMPPTYVGGLGQTGVDALREFVDQGGTLIALDAASDFAIDRFGLPVSDEVSKLGRDEFFCPGSLLRIQVDTESPVGYGMSAEATAFFVRSRGFSVADDAEGVRAVATYAERDLLQSGWILGADKLQGRQAVLDVGVGRGRIVLLGFRVQFRAQPYGTFKLLFNSLLAAAAQPERLR